jgi:hypothetical protein
MGEQGEAASRYPSSRIHLQLFVESIESLHARRHIPLPRSNHFRTLLVVVLRSIASVRMWFYIYIPPTLGPDALLSIRKKSVWRQYYTRYRKALQRCGMDDPDWKGLEPLPWVPSGDPLLDRSMVCQLNIIEMMRLRADPDIVNRIVEATKRRPIRTAKKWTRGGATW